MNKNETENQKEIRKGNQAEQTRVDKEKGILGKMLTNSIFNEIITAELSLYFTYLLVETALRVI